jgi:hypothetical protein
MSLYNKASLVQIPSGTKSGTLYSVLPANGDGDFDHTRATSATRVNKDGLIESVASGVPRLDYPLIDGVVQSCPALLLEPSRANKLPYSLDYDNNTYYQKSNSTATSESGISPDGANTAYELKDTDDTGNTSHYIQQASGYRAVIDYDAIKTASVFVKAGTKKQVQVRLTNGAGSFSYIMGNFDLETETILTGASANASDISYDLQNYGNGWYRCIVSGSWDLSNVTQSIIQVFTADLSLAALPDMHNYQGDGTGTLFIWGQMIEEGSYATSYIPTSGSAVTRNADVCNGAGTSAEFNDSEGVLFAEIAALDNDLTHRRISISDGTTGNLVYVSFDTTSNRILANANGRIMIYVTEDETQFQKVAVYYNATAPKLYVNGFLRETETAMTAITGLSELAFDNAVGGNNFYGKTKQLMTFNEALTDSELEQITSWTSFGEMAKGQLYTIE